MRKYFATLVSAAMMVMWSGCSSEVIEEGPDEHNGVIGFGTTHVAKASKALTNDNFSKFYVYGTYKPSTSTAAVVVFNGTEVFKTNGNWDYSDGGKRYWVTGQYYNFYAYSSENEKFAAGDGNIFNANLNDRVLNLVGVLSDGDHQSDLTFAKTLDQIQEKKKDEAGYVAHAPVNLEFKHILTRVKFQIETHFVADAKYEVTISELKIVNFRNKGNFMGTNEEWDANSVERYPASSTPELTLELADKDQSWTVNGADGVISTKPIYMIPFNYAEANVRLTFKIQVKDQSNQEVLDRTVTAQWQPEWKKGTSLNNVIKITGGEVGLDPIEFTGSLVSTSDDGWADGGSGVINGMTFDAN